MYLLYVTGGGNHNMHVKRRRGMKTNLHILQKNPKIIYLFINEAVLVKNN
jgi:hypothetical protein